MKNKINLVFTISFLLILSCNNEAVNDKDYKALNTVFYRQVKNDAIFTLVKNDIDSKDSIYLNNELKKYGFEFKAPSKDYFTYKKLYDSLLFYNNKFTYTIKDSLFKYDPNSMSSKVILYINLKDYKEDIIFDLDKIILPSNCIKIDSKSDIIKYKDHIYVGEYSISRILYNKKEDGGYIVVRNNYIEGNGAGALYEILKRGDKWVITN